MDLKLQAVQTQVLSQKMIQSAQILQMSSQEMEVYIKDMALENPVIDLEEQYESGCKDEDIRRKIEWLESSDEQNRVYYNNEYTDDEEHEQWNFNVEEGETLSEYLLAQLLTKNLTALQMKIADYIVNCLDDKGYFCDAISEVAEHLQVRQEQVDEVLSVLKELEPAGICAQNISECLLLQLERKGMKTPILTEIISNYLELLGKNQLHVIAKKVKLPVEQVQVECEKIKELNPKPGSAFCSRETLKYITPDVTVVKLGGYYEILLNEYMYPRICVNSYYKSMLDDDVPKEAKEYISDKVRQAEWVMNCISQRNKTLLQVAKAIVDMQENFFMKGQGYLEPMRQVDVAEKISVHESTVSRAVRDKYLQCSWGVFPMNYFFSKGIVMENGQKTVTPDKIKQLMSQIIAQENKKKPYSDRLISEKLEEAGVHISRRTVAKYREEVGIKDASGRRAY